MTTPILQPRAEATVHSVLGGSISIRLRSAQTDGRLALIENVIPPQYDGLPLHVHPEFDEAFYLLEGALTFTVADAQLTATPGTLVWTPGWVPHTFHNYASEPARMLLWTVPGGHEQYFDRLVEALADGPPEVSSLTALMSEHGITVVEQAA